MTVVEQARAVIVPFCTEQKVDELIVALATKRITFVELAASEELFTRWHAHCRFLGKESGRGYDEIYNHAIAYAMEMEEKFKVLPQTVIIAGEEITVDIKVPGPTTKASNKELLVAYEYIVDTAKEIGVRLPERRIVLPETGGI